MVRRIEATLAWALIALGAAQSFVGTPVFFRAASEPALWFFGGGLSLMLVGALNLVRLGAGGAVAAVRRLCIATNVVFALWWLSMAVALWSKFVRHPASFTGVVVLVFVGLLSLAPRRSSGA